MNSENIFGPVRVIKGKNNGRYPYCHSFYLEEDKILIDPASNRNEIERLKSHNQIKTVWLTHWHEDHIMHLDLFKNFPLWMSEEDSYPLKDLEVYLDWFDAGDEKFRTMFRESMVQQFNFSPRFADRFLKDGEIIQLESSSIEVIQTPGHSPGHLAFFLKESGILILGDYDLSSFGPWYGDTYSSIKDTIKSINRLRNIPAKLWLTSHEKGIYTENPGEIWDAYINKIDERECELFDLLKNPKTMHEIIHSWIIYKRERQPIEFYESAERALISKHLEKLIQEDKVVKEGETFVRA